MNDGATEKSPQTYARTAGVLYLILIVAGSFAEIGIQGMVAVRNDPAATARNILAHELLYRWGLVTGVIAIACHLSLAVVLYNLFKRVSKDLALLTAGFILLACAIDSVNLVNEFGALNVLQGAGYAIAFNVEQLHALAYMALRSRGIGHTLGLLFVGIYFILLGYMIFRSSLLPRVMGVLLALGGAGYLTLSFARFLAPDFAFRLFPTMVLPAAIAMLSLTVWLLVKGVNVQRWKEQAEVSGR